MGKLFPKCKVKSGTRYIIHCVHVHSLMFFCKPYGASINNKMISSVTWSE